MERTFCDLPIGRGTSVRVSLRRFGGRQRIDVRQYYQFRHGDRDSAQPTRRGASLPVELLPQLRAALEAAERTALDAGFLEPEDYLDAGLPAPAALLRPGGRVRRHA